MTFPKRKFGVEIEYYGIPRSNLIDALKAIRVKCVSEDYNHRVRRHWKIVSDGSVEGAYAAELVSPPLSGKRGITTLRKVISAIKAAGARVNDSCGFHVHVDSHDLSPNQVMAVVQRYGFFEKRIDNFMSIQRTNSNWAKRVNGRYLNSMIQNHNFSSLEFKTFARYSDRYRKVNIASLARHGTIEFRQHEGTVNPDEVVNWTQFCVHFVDQISKDIEASNLKHFTMPPVKNRSLYHGIPDDVAEYYKNVSASSSSKKKKKKTCVQS